MASSCPTNKVAMDTILQTLNDIAQANPAVRTEIQDINGTIEAGMRLRSGFVKRGGKRKYSKKRLNRKRTGGMPPKRKAEEEEITDPDKNKLLNAIAHIIAAGTIAGGTGAFSCYIYPAIEAYLVGAGIVPKLCTQSVEWGLRLMAGAVSSIETCATIQVRYELIVKQIIAAIGIPSGLGLLYERAKFVGGYMKYKNAIYNLLNRCVQIIKAKIESMLRKKGTTMTGETPEISEDEIAEIVDAQILNEFGDVLGSEVPNTSGLDSQMTVAEQRRLADVAIEREFPELRETSSSVGNKDTSSSWFSRMFSRESSKSPERERERSQTPDVQGEATGEGYGNPYGGARRQRKRKTVKKRSKKLRKTRKHRSLKH